MSNKVEHKDAPEELKYNANEGRAQTLTRQILGLLDRLGKVSDVHPEDGSVRRSFINQLNRSIKYNLEDAVKNLRAKVKSESFTFSIRKSSDENSED